MRIETEDRESRSNVYLCLTVSEAEELRGVLDDLVRQPRADWHSHVSSSDYQTEVTVTLDAP